MARLFHKTNRDLVQDTGDDKFLTLFYGVLDDQDCSLAWVSGGHDPALWYHADHGTVEELPNTGMLMGIFEDVTFEQAGPGQRAESHPGATRAISDRSNGKRHER